MLDCNVAIAATFELRPGRYPELDSIDLFRTILSESLREWNISPREIDGLLTTPCVPVGGSPDTYIHQKLNALLGGERRFSETLNVGGASYCVMIDRATAAIRAGRAEAVLCIGASKFNKVGVNIVADPDFEAPYGPSIPALYGLVASQFMARGAATREDLAAVAVSTRAWALLNPNARMYGAGPLTIDQVLDSRPIATPYNYLDCSIPSEGGGAILVAREDVAQRICQRAAYVLGYGEFHKRGSLSGADDLLDDGSFESGRQAFDGARLTHDDIDIVQLYDSFSATPLMLLESLGFCAPGCAGEFVRGGATAPGGRLPMNTGGGLMSYGHTGNAGGLSLVIEAARQIMGEAGPRQVTNAQTALVHCYAGIKFDHSTLILGPRP